MLITFVLLYLAVTVGIGLWAAMRVRLAAPLFGMVAGSYAPLALVRARHG